MLNNFIETITSKRFQSRFWKKVKIMDKNDCWLWKASKDGSGYGLMHLTDKKRIKAHRAAWIISNGKIPNTKHILHSCDNPACVNPEHLWVGTNLENMQDKMKKGRFVHGDRSKSTGEKSHFSKITESQIIKMRNLYHTSGTTYKNLAQLFGISYQQVGAIITHRAWKHVKEGT